MIRSPQALLASLSLHLLLAAAIVVFAIPHTASSRPVSRCVISLSRVVPAMPVKETRALRRSHKAASSHKAAVKAVKNMKAPAKRKPVEPAVKSAPEPVTTVETVKMAAPVKADHVERQAEPVMQKMPTREAKRAPVVKTAQAKNAVQSGDRYLQEHIATIAALLREYLYYPRLARKRHIEGEVLAVFTLEADGTVRDVRVKKHARAMLDHAAIRTIESLSGRFPHPEGTMTLEVPIRFVLK